MNIYFAASIRGGRDDGALYHELVQHLKAYGTVLSEHVANPALTAAGSGSDERRIHDQDVAWIEQCDVMVAEVTTPSLGVGYEIGRAIEKRKRVLYLYRPQADKKLSAMIAGCPHIFTAEYQTLDEAKEKVDGFFEFIGK